VSRLTSFGAFVTLAPGVDGLIHISRLGGGRKIHHPREVVETGQTIEVKVEGVDQEGQKISLVPADFVSVESEKVVEEDEYKKYLAQKTPKKEEADLGSFGALLQAQMRNRK
jgi:small subunit ribosomal protein S1